MPACSCCTHPQREAIDAALVNRDSLRDIAGRFSVSKSAVERHKAEHLPSIMVKSEEAKEVARADDLIAQLKEISARTERLYSIANGIIGKAATAEDWRTALMAVREASNANREARANLELLGELLGELNRTPTVNIHLSAEWLQLRTVILQTLAPFPDARAALARTLTDGPHAS